MAALLNSLQMGFRTLAIQKHSSEVWDVLGAVKTEFNKFGAVLAATQSRLNQANSELDKLIGVRTRSILRKLRDVSGLPEQEAASMLEIMEPAGAEAGVKTDRTVGTKIGVESGMTGGDKEDEI